MYYQNRANSTALQVVLFGPSGHGKSTLGARFMHQLGGIPEREKNRMDDEARALGRPDHGWAMFFDRRMGPPRLEQTLHSPNTSINNCYFGPYHCSMYIAPGRLRKYSRRIAITYAMAELPVLVISAHGTQFEDSLEDIRQHLFLLFTQQSNYYAGEKADEKKATTSNNTNTNSSTTTTEPTRGTLHTSSRLKKKPPLILVVTRLDPTHVNDTKARFEQIRDKVLHLSSFFQLVHAIPTFDGLNVSTPDRLYEGQLPMTLLDALSDERWKQLIPPTLEWSELERQDRERQRQAEHKERVKQREIDESSKSRNRKLRQVVEIPEQELCLSLLFDRYHIGGIGTVICGKQIRSELAVTRPDAPMHIYFCLRVPQEKKQFPYSYYSTVPTPTPTPSALSYDVHKLSYKSLQTQQVTHNYEIRDAKVFSVERHHEMYLHSTAGAIHGMNIKPGLPRMEVKRVLRGSIAFTTPANCYSMAPRWLREKPYCVIATLVLPNMPGPEYIELNAQGHAKAWSRNSRKIYHNSPSARLSLKSTSHAGKLQARREKRKRNKMGYRAPTGPYDEATCPYYDRPALSKAQRRENAKHLHVGSTYMMFCHGAHTVVQVTSLRLVDVKSRSYRVFLRPETFIQLSTDPYFCKFALMDHHAVRGMGRIMGVFYEEALKVNLFLKCAAKAESNLAMLNRDVVSYIVATFSLLFQ